MDEFSATRDILISIGSDKADILSKLIADAKPKIAIEIGGYLGYSAILFADAMRRANDVGQELHVWSLELSSEFASIAREMIDLAGLSDIVTVVVGTAEVSLQRLKSEGKLDKVDLVFLDHAEELYVSDFQLCEKLNLLQKGSIIVADNVVRPGAPEYRALVRSNPGFKSDGVKGLILPGGFEVSTPMNVL